MKRIVFTGLLLAGAVCSAQGAAWEAPPGLRLHLDAATRDSLDLNAENEVLFWRDTIHPGTVFAPPSEAPRLVPDAVAGNPSVRFEGKAYLATDAWAARVLTRDVTGLTFFVVWRASDAGNQTIFRIGEGRSLNALRLMLDYTDTGIRMLARRWDRDAFATMAVSSKSDQAWKVDAGMIDYVNAWTALFRNGELLGEESGFLSPGRTSPLPSLMFRIGRDHRDQYLRGDIAEILIFDRVLTPREMTSAGQYLAEKFRLDIVPFTFVRPELTAEQVREVQAAKLSQEELDLTLQPAPILFNPGPEYSAEARDYAMVIGMDRTPGGRIWAAWVAGGDSEKGYFVVATSDDDGETWSDPRMVIDPPNLSETILQRTLVGNFWTDPAGRLWLFYDQSLGYFDGRGGVWAITCDNPDADEPVWSEPRRIGHGATLNKPLVLDNGEWLLPVSLWTRDWIRTHIAQGPAGPFEDVYRELDPLRMAHLLVSTDEGQTWRLRGSVAAEQRRFDEPMPIKLRDGRLWMPIRTYYGLADTYSSDSGRTWSTPVPSRIQHVPRGARIFLRRLASGRILLVKHGPIEEQRPRRSHLTAFLSDDDGETWSHGLILDERATVSYPDGFQTPDGRIFIIYDWNRSTDNEILMARFREEDILAGVFHTPGARTRMRVEKAGVSPTQIQVGTRTVRSIDRTADGIPVVPMWQAPMPLTPGFPGAGFAVLENAEHAKVWSPPDRESGAYNHYAALAFHEGRFFAMWGNHPLGEDGPGQRVLYAWSDEWGEWSEPLELFPAPGPVKPRSESGIHLKPDRWMEVDGVLYAVVYVHGAGRYPMARAVRPDGRLEAPFYVVAPPGGRERLAFMPADNPVVPPVADRILDGYRQNHWISWWAWTRPEVPSRGVDGATLIESFTYRAIDGQQVLMMRDWGHTGNPVHTNRMYVMFGDGAEAWLPPHPSDIPDSPSRAEALVLGDGTVLLIGNQIAPHFDQALYLDRDPLTVSISRDGYVFDRVYALRSGAKPTYTFPGVRGRNLGFAYPSSLVHEGRLYTLYSIGKEDMGITRVRLSDMGLGP